MRKQRLCIYLLIAFVAFIEILWLRDYMYFRSPLAPPPKQKRERKGKGNVVVKKQYQINTDEIRDIEAFMESLTYNSEASKVSRQSEGKQKEIRIFCFVLTTPKTIHTKAYAVNGTWGRRCTKIMFVTSCETKLSNVLSLNITESRKHLTMKTVQTLKHVYRYYLDSYDWFLKADDDVYVVMENLKYLVSHYNSSTPVYIGHNFRLFTKQGYMSGGAGYVMSREAVRVLNEKGFQKPGRCAHDGSDEDLDIGKCFDKIGVKPYNTIDQFGRQSFHPFGLLKAISGGYVNGESDYIARPYKTGKDCCSQLSITFHYVNPMQMYMLEMLLYNFNVFGRSALTSSNESFFPVKESIISGKKTDEILLPVKRKTRAKNGYFTF